MPKNYYEILKSKSIPVRFQRTMGLFGAVTLGVGALMGAGVYVLIGIAARTAGPGVWVSYFVCGLLAMFSMLSYQRLSTQVPISGGGYAYAYQGLGGFWGFVTGWHLALGSIFACSLYAIGFSYYATSFLHTPLPPYAAKGIAILLVLSFTALNSGGAKGGDRMQKIFTWGNVAVLLIVVVASLRVANTDHLTPHFPHGPMGVVGTIPIIYISFFGYQLIANNSEEIVNPERNLPLSMVLSLLIAWAIYVGIALVAVTTIPWEQLGHSSAPLALVARKSLGGVGLVLVGVGGSLASAAALNSTLLSQARQIFAMGRDKLMMRLLGELHEQTRTPRAALWFGGIGVCLTIALGEVEFISKIAGFSFLLSMLPVSLALHRYEKDRAAAGVPVGLWRRSVPWIAFVANLALLSTMAVDLTVSIFGLILAAVGLLMFFGYSRAREQRGRTGLNVVLTEKKERGAFPFAGGQRILVPMANPKTLDWLFKSSHALFKKRGGEVVLLSIVTATEQVDFHTALANTPSSAVVNLEHAAELAAASKVPFRPVVRVSRDLASGIVHAAEEEHCELVIMGYSAASDPNEPSLTDQVIAHCNRDLIIMKFKSDTFAPKRIGVSLGSTLNMDLMVKLAGALAEEYGGMIEFINIVSAEYTEEEVARSGRLLMEAISKHAARALYRVEVINAESPLDALVERSAHLDLLVAGTTRVSLLQRAAVGSFATQLTQRSECSVALVRVVPPVKRIIHT